MTSMNFEDSDIKMNYAKAKFALAAVVGVVYCLIEGIVLLVSSGST